MNRGIGVALSAIALTTLGSMWFIAAMDRRPPSEPGAPPREAIAAAPAAPPVAPPGDAPRSAPAAGAPAPPPGHPPAGWDLPTDPARRLKALQALQDEVRAELETLDLRAGCDLRDVSVALTLETRDREVRIVEAVVRRRTAAADREVSGGPVEGEVDEAVARCVQDRIRGMTLRAPSARAGRRWSTFYSPPPRRP